MKTALLALLMLALTACQAFPPTSRTGDGREAAADGGSDSNTPVISGVNELDRERQAQRRQRRTPPPRPEPAPPRGELGEKALTGLTTNQTWDLLGPPTQVQEESPATVWTYEIADCRLELFFYFDLESQEQRTLALDLEAASDFVGSRPFCWYTLAKRGRGRETPLPQADTASEGRDSARVPTADEVGDTGEAAGDPETAGTSRSDGAAEGDEGEAAAPPQQDAQAKQDTQAQQEAPDPENARAPEDAPAPGDASAADDGPGPDDGQAQEDAKAPQEAPAQEESAQ